MKSSELRIGNLVKRKGWLLEDKKYDETIVLSADIAACTGNNKDFKEIYLTTEFLERTELEQSGILYQKGKFAIKPWVVGGEIEWVIFWGDKAILYEKNYPVHRLQNLYFALSNEELQIK